MPWELPAETCSPYATRVFAEAITKNRAGVRMKKSLVDNGEEVCVENKAIWPGTEPGAAMRFSKKRKPWNKSVGTSDDLCRHRYDAVKKHHLGWYTYGNEGSAYRGEAMQKKRTVVLR